MSTLYTSISSVQLFDLSQKLESKIKTEFPSFKLIDKKDSKFMIFLSYLVWIFNRKFMTDFATTVGYTIYLVSRITINSPREKIVDYISLLLHEYQHMKDKKKFKLLYDIFYFSPQILSVLSIFSIWNHWFLLFLFFLAPFPSLRSVWEIRGYKISAAVYYWLTGLDENIDWIVSQFTSSNYYFMCPFKGLLMNLFKKHISDVREDKLNSQLREISQFLVT